MNYGSCVDVARVLFPEKAYCCSSCHEDELDGYDMCEIELDANTIYIVCCAVTEDVCAPENEARLIAGLQRP